MFPWGHDRRFNAYSNFFKGKFGFRVQKLSIDAGFTCPNRDGSRGIGGCTFCLNDAFNPSYCHPSRSITNQIQEGKEFHRWRYNQAPAYLAYFQAFSNTYAPLQKLRELYEEALSDPDVIGLVIGTRPDCIDEQKLEYFAELGRRFFISIEYGIESCYPETLERINRGHSIEETFLAIYSTAAAGIHTGAHLIFGLPGETPQMMLDQARILSRLPLSSIKFHQLQIVKGTSMELEYQDHPGDFHFFQLPEYIDFLIQFLEHLNPDFVVERFAGEMPPRFSTGPNWGKIRNEQIVAMIEKQLFERNTWQGRLFQPDNKPDV